jgi:hypothetical protein
VVPIVEMLHGYKNAAYDTVPHKHFCTFCKNQYRVAD